MEKFFPEGDEELKMLDRCAAALEPEFFITSLSKLNNSYPELQSLKRKENSKKGKREGACSKDPYNRAVLWYLLPNYEEVLENRAIERRRRRIGRSAKNEEVVEDIPEIFEMRKPADYVSYRINDINDLHDTEPLRLRPYQEELVEMALRGKNTIACAPTGCGKTEVSIYVAVSHLDEKAEKNEPGRVAMLVPRIPLVDQQKQRFQKYIRGKYYVEGLHGSGVKGASRRDAVLACDIVVMTPQILLHLGVFLWKLVDVHVRHTVHMHKNRNMLKSIIKDERLYVCDFSLLIFDEVHHCTKDHPYNILMQTVHDYKGPKPQTMGLTASLGVGISTTEESGMAAVYELLANLGATVLSSVRRHTDILAQYVPKPVDCE
ncbi:DEAD/DEAH box helicase [Dictyocaulus viviparus]|uniref:DEAD/DEAH box helicase n=1 Tax=Dictyocaulus viviparus TaxID=29172 RepID=A0A0D8XGW5_DICVI|nr:DEAD/DEAH box helicase [Dictyocaulus viviparus]